jgi:hypothetical protein
MRRFAWTALAALSLVGCPSNPPPADDGGQADTGGRDAGPRCAVDTDCDDGRYCDGVERCAPSDPSADARGCVSNPSPCMPSQQCIESERRCVTVCAVQPDADGDGASSITCGGIDCDDADANRYPTNHEVCDDAGHDEDCNPTTYGFRDADGDGDVDAACCNEDPATHVHICGGDCADQRRDVRSGLAESCDALDNDCDGTIDEGVTRMGAPDRDYDLHGDATAMVAGCPGDPGFSQVHDDCNDSSPTAFGAQLEICDGMDNNCNGMADETMGQVTWYPDADGDGFGGNDAAQIVVSCAIVPGHVTRPGDCDDARSDVHPGARELCNGMDDDCNGRADYTIRPGDTEDDDGDAAADQRCGGDDCDDANAAVGPHAPELTDMLDNDCNGLVDDSPGTAMWWLDRDRDGWGDASSTPMTSSTPIASRVTRGGDCDDGDVYVHPGAPDPCDHIDQNCDGVIDDTAPLLAFFHDGDADGWADASPTGIVLACSAPASSAARVGDCVDTNASIYPAAPELCDMLDDDCDGRIDETPTTLWYVDADGDGVGADPGAASCTVVAGRVTTGGDCDDTNAFRYPGRAEDCNGTDDDCDGTIDEGASAACGGPHTTGGACAMGRCTLTCASGWSDCDGVTASGCEVDTAHAGSSCGTCFHACALGDSCGAIAAAGTCDDAPVAELSGAGEFFFARRATGGVVAWGDGEWQQLAQADTVSRTAPVAARILGLDLVGATRVAVHGRAGYSGGGCALTRAGGVSCWGNGYANQPSYDFGGAVIAIATVSGGLCAVRADHHAFCLGNDSGEHLVNGPSASSTNDPLPIVDASGPVTDAIDVAMSDTATCVLRERPTGDRYLSCGGGGWVNGNGRSSFVVDVAGLPADLVALARGYASDGMCVRTNAGAVWCWGTNNQTSGLLGLGPMVNTTGVPTLLVGLESGVVDLVLSARGGCAIRAGSGGARDALCWGDSNGATFGWPGDGSAHTGIDQPRILGPAGAGIHDALAVARSDHSACVVRASGGVWCAGDDTYGELGDGPGDSTGNAFVRVSGFP